jgi:hypothetical protein
MNFVIWYPSCAGNDTNYTNDHNFRLFHSTGGEPWCELVKFVSHPFE